MKVDYINHELTEEFARCTFLGYDPATGKRRRPVIELDSGDLARLIEIARSFRTHQRRIAAAHTSRADRITESGVSE